MSDTNYTLAFDPDGLLRPGQWHRITILHAPHSQNVVGKTIETVVCERGRDPLDVYFDLIIENSHTAQGIFDYIDEANIRTLLRHPATMICSDGQVLAPRGFLNDPPPILLAAMGSSPLCWNITCAMRRCWLLKKPCAR